MDDPEATLASLESLQAELPLLVEGQAEAIGALVKLFAAAEAEGEADVSRLAERIIWHELTDAEISIQPRHSSAPPSRRAWPTRMWRRTSAIGAALRP
ncbi:MAG: hypothetical protein R3D25_07095 [Geminicoccaceae bacterium]